MELREKFEAADTDNGDSLDQQEFLNAFKNVIGKDMSDKEFNQLFMKIDADSNGSVEWNEFMNYMLLENQTLSNMKTEHFEYVKSKLPDPPPSHNKLCHKKNITSIIVIYPEMISDIHYSKGTQEYRNHIKFVTGSADGKVKVWPYIKPDSEATDGKEKKYPWGKTECEQTIEVSTYMVLAITFMTLSKRLVAASADRKISFYEVTNGQRFSLHTCSKIENLLAIPLCLEYHRWNTVSFIDDDIVTEEKDKNEKQSGRQKLETLIVGDDLGLITKYDFTQADWHWCHFDPKKFKKNDLGNIVLNYCCNKEIDDEYQKRLDTAFKADKAAAIARNKAIREKEKQSRSKQDDDEERTQDRIEVQQKMKPLEREGRRVGVHVKTKHAHRGWITKIKYYPDLNYLFSSSLDGFIHVHDIDKLAYKNKTFNLHQKGINSFVYSNKHRFIASCGEERYIIMWDPFTLGILTHLNGHNTSVQDLAINEDRNHLISLGTDKMVKIWDIRSYTNIQTIVDKINYRPDDILTSLTFEPETNNILLGSRKINFWFFKTQEESKTSHDAPVAFALYNTQFENVVSGSDDGFIAVWDIENGRQLTKFGDAHGKGNKLTAATFDSTQRRMVSAGSDGTVKIWNFSNGSALKNLLSQSREITSLLCVYEASDLDRPSFFVAAGWDKRLKIWPDDRASEEENVPCSRDLPNGYLANNTKNQLTHGDDIMSACYDTQNKLIFTGGHDGTILAWHFETGFIKFYLHQQDPTCTSEKHILDAKSVDSLFIMKEKSVLISATADQTLRFWDLLDLQSQKYILGSMKVNHAEGDALTTVTVNEECTRMITSDSAGRLKLWDISKVDWRHDRDNLASKMREVWFIQAHRALINTVSIVETYKNHERGDSDSFVLSCGNDCNILLHRLLNGQKVGQFGQQTWDITRMSQIRRRPAYVREWFEVRKKVWKDFVIEKIEEAKKKGLLDQYFKFKPKQMDPAEMKRLGFTKSDGEASFEDPNSDNDNIKTEDFYSDEEDDLKQFKGTKLGGGFIKQVKNESKNHSAASEVRWFEEILKHEPDIKKWGDLTKRKDEYRPEKILERYEQERQGGRDR